MVLAVISVVLIGLHLIQTSSPPPESSTAEFGKKEAQQTFIADIASLPESSSDTTNLEESNNGSIDNALAILNVQPPTPKILTQVQPIQEPQIASNQFQTTNDASFSRKACATNLRKIFDAAVRVGQKSSPGIPRLPVDLMLLRSEFTNASVFICPGDPNSANVPVEWENFGSKFISYRFALDIVRGNRDTQVGIDYPYLRCPIHNLRLTGNRNVMPDKSGNHISDDY